MSEDKTDAKLGAGHASAMARQGLAELRAALYADSNVAQPAEYGMYGRPTPQEIVDDKTAEATVEPHAPSVLEERMAAEPATGREPESREPPEPERD
jgi:hypothetical protein